nr:ribonuclease H-like domain-containing protein [Tanacetum cinerariifolium]
MHIHTQIELLDLEFLDSVGQCFQNLCQRAVTELIDLVEPHNLLFSVVDREHDYLRRLTNVLFTDTECVVLSPDFKLLDESQFLLKATLDESNLWNRRLGHINFKTINKLVRGTLVRGFPLKIFENDHTCVACQKGKQQKASYHLGKFDGKSDDGFFMGYSINSKAFRAFNTRTRFVEKNMHINFLENKPNVSGTGPNWMFDIDTLIMSMNYQPVFVGNQTNGNACTKANINAGQAGKKTVPSPQYVLLPLLTSNFQGLKSLEDEVADDAGKKSTEVPRKKNGVQDPTKEGDKHNQEKDVRDQDEALRKQFEQESERFFGQGEATNTNSTNILNIVSSPINAVSSSFTTVDPGRERAQRNEFESMFGQDNDANGNSTYRMFIPVSTAGSFYEDTADLQDTRIFGGAYDDEVKGAVADFNNLELTTVVSPIPTTRTHKDHLKEQIIGDHYQHPKLGE